MAGTVQFFLPALPEIFIYSYPEPETTNNPPCTPLTNSVTLLFQLPMQDGLEILLPKGGGWKPVPVSPPGYSGPPPILVNLGDLLSYWTAGLLRSTVHRVVFPPKARRGGEDRYSMVYFCHPVDTTVLVPVPSKIVQERGDRGANEAEGKMMTAAEHLASRLAATYGWGK